MIHASSLNLDSLRYLLESASSGNFGHAAESLGVRTSTVSRRVARFEDELGLTLFERGHSGVRLTMGGRVVIAHVRRILAEVEAIKVLANRSASGTIGQIRIGIRMPPIGKPLQPLFGIWHRRYPDVELVLCEMSERDLMAAIEERRLDIALIAKHALWPRVASQSIYRGCIFLAMPKSHALAIKKKLTWGLIRDETFLVQVGMRARPPVSSTHLCSAVACNLERTPPVSSLYWR